MLSALDDTLWHQLATTFDHVGTSDPRFFDRYWFAAYARDGRAALQFTLGVYRNMNVVDGAVVVIINGQQHNLRVSRTLGVINEAACGPLSVEVLTPLQAFRLTVSDDDGGIRGEIVWNGIAPPQEEAPHFKRANGRVIEDYQRFNQIGAARGWIEAGGSRVEIDDWWGCRDHSWGVRPRIGISEPKTGATDSLDKRGFTMAFMFFSTEQTAGTLLLMQREGELAYTSGTLTNRATTASQEIVSVSLQPTLVEGTRRFSQVAVRVTLEEGQTLDLTCACLGHAVAMKGLGYSGGYDDKKGLGVWRGDLHIERDIWDVADPAVVGYPDGARDRHWHRIQPVTVQEAIGAAASQGVGSMTLILSGAIPALGLT